MQLDPEAVLSENEHVLAKLDTISYSGLPGHDDFDLDNGGSGKLVLTENSESGERFIYLVHNFQKRSIDFQERFDRDWVGNCCGEEGYPCCPRTPSSSLAQNYLVTRQDIKYAAAPHAPPAPPDTAAAASFSRLLLFVHSIRFCAPNPARLTSFASTTSCLT